MSNYLNKLTNCLFKKNLHDCNAGELEQITRQYPYFGPAQLLLAKKMQEENSSQFTDQVQTTSLYFQNRLWLHHLLNNEGISSSVNDYPADIEKNIPAENVIQNEPAPDLFGHVAEEKKETEVVDQTIEQEIREQPEASFEMQHTNGETAVEVITGENKDLEIISEPVGQEVKEQTGTTHIPPSFKIEPLAPNAGMTFQPYHTVDYFASQGIKFKEDEKPPDRFGQQLKSFTEWLKMMKRVPATEIVIATDSNVEKKVEQMAEHSLAERHVITEAMAEVWIKQGNIAKAGEIYHKLSLLDPSKSSYFAAKIEELKKTS